MYNTIQIIQRHFYLFIFTVLLVPLSAQKSSIDIGAFKASRSVFRLHGPLPAVQCELRIAPTTTLSVTATTWMQIYTRNYNGANILFINPIPVLNGAVNQYLNVRRRIAKGKRVDRFSANYVYLRGAYLFYEDPLFTVAAGYGLTRNIGRIGFWRAGIGISAGKPGNQVQFIPDAVINIGICLPKADIKYALKSKNRS